MLNLTKSRRINMIKAIAFDLGGVFLKENNFVLNETEQSLERSFGVLDNLDEYLDYHAKSTGLTKEEIREKTIYIITNIYE